MGAKVGEGNLQEPPDKGWMLWKNGKFSSVDETAICSSQPSAACEEITVELGGEAKEKYPECAGRYLPVKGRYIRGREVRSLNQTFQEPNVVCLCVSR